MLAEPASAAHCTALHLSRRRPAACHSPGAHARECTAGSSKSPSSSPPLPHTPPHPVHDVAAPPAVGGVRTRTRSELSTSRRFRSATRTPNSTADPAVSCVTSIRRGDPRFAGSEEIRGDPRRSWIRGDPRFATELRVGGSDGGSGGGGGGGEDSRTGLWHCHTAQWNGVVPSAVGWLGSRPPSSTSQRQTGRWPFRQACESPPSSPCEGLLNCKQSRLHRLKTENSPCQTEKIARGESARGAAVHFTQCSAFRPSFGCRTCAVHLIVQLTVCKPGAAPPSRAFLKAPGAFKNGQANACRRGLCIVSVRAACHLCALRVISVHCKCAGVSSLCIACHLCAL